MLVPGYGTPVPTYRTSVPARGNAIPGADVERLGRAIKEVRARLTAHAPESDPEFTAAVQEALAQLGYWKPGPPH